MRRLVAVGAVTVAIVGVALAVQIQPIKPGGPPVISDPSPCQVECGKAYRTAYNSCNDAFLTDVGNTIDASLSCQAGAGDNVISNALCIQKTNQDLSTNSRNRSACVTSAAQSAALCNFLCGQAG